MRARGLRYEPLVAFSGTVKDPNTGAEFTEASLNALGGRTNVRDAFKLPQYRILIVANKFQTGFDCPPLHAMWVDKRLGGVSAVQTLSRLNRTMRGKTETVVMDFVNEAEAIQQAFQPYYQKTALAEETNPSKLHDQAYELAHLDVYTCKDVDDFADVFARNLSRKLPRREGAGLPQEILDEVNLDDFRIQETYQGELELEAEDGEVYGIPIESGSAREPETDYLSNIVTSLNELHDLSDRERVEQIVKDVEEDDSVEAVMTGSNSKSNKWHRVNSVADKHILAQVNDSIDLYQKLTDPKTNRAFKRHLFNQLLHQFAG